MELTQGLQGAETVPLALESAIAAAADCGFPPSEPVAWQARAAELGQAIVDHFLVPGPPEHFEGNRPAWILWPVTFLASTDPRARSHAQYLDDQFVAPLLSRAATGGALPVRGGDGRLREPLSPRSNPTTTRRGDRALRGGSRSPEEQAGGTDRPPS